MRREWVWSVCARVWVGLGWGVVVGAGMGWVRGYGIAWGAKIFDSKGVIGKILERKKLTLENHFACKPLTDSKGLRGKSQKTKEIDLQDHFARKPPLQIW